MKIDNIDHLNTATAQRVGVSCLHESADLHVSGTATYTDDLPELQGTAHIALGMSEKAHARLLEVNLDAVRQALEHAGLPRTGPFEPKRYQEHAPALNGTGAES